MKNRYIDIHCHLHEFKDDEVKRIIEEVDVFIVAVSDDLKSTHRTLKLAREYPDRVHPCIGLHPWSVGEVKAPLEQAQAIAKLAEREGVTCIGEVGLDTKFVPQTIDVQRKVFDVFLQAAVELDAFMNLHTAGTWEEVLNLIVQRGVRRANFHWYTGPQHLLERIREQGYTISVNPAVKIQRRHAEIVKIAPLDMIVTESDGPYQYRGLNLSPVMIPETIELVARLKQVSVDEVMDAVRRNAARVLRL